MRECSVGQASRAALRSDLRGVTHVRGSPLDVQVLVDAVVVSVERPVEGGVLRPRKRREVERDRSAPCRLTANGQALAEEPAERQREYEQRDGKGNAYRARGQPWIDHLRHVSKK